MSIFNLSSSGFLQPSDGDVESGTEAVCLPCLAQKSTFGAWEWGGYVICHMTGSRGERCGGGLWFLSSSFLALCSWLVVWGVFSFGCFPADYLPTLVVSTCSHHLVLIVCVFHPVMHHLTDPSRRSFLLAAHDQDSWQDSKSSIFTWFWMHLLIWTYLTFWNIRNETSWHLKSWHWLFGNDHETSWPDELVCALSLSKLSNSRTSIEVYNPVYSL